MATISGIDPIAAARLAYERIRTLGDPAFDDLPTEDKAELIDLGITDPTISRHATINIQVDLD